MLSQQVLEAWIQRIDDTASARIRGNAQDISELAERADKLEIERVGNDRTFREVISDIAELAQRIEGLEEKQGNLWAKSVFAVNGLAQRVNALVKWIEKLGGQAITMTGLFMEGDLALGKRIEEFDEAALELARHIKALVEQIEKLEKLPESRIEPSASPESCSCIGCGQPIEFESHVCYTLYGHPDADPPDATRECLTCWDGHAEKYREHTYRASWIKPVVVRNGKVEPYIPKED